LGGLSDDWSYREGWERRFGGTLGKTFALGWIRLGAPLLFLYPEAVGGVAATLLVFRIGKLAHLRRELGAAHKARTQLAVHNFIRRPTSHLLFLFFMFLY
jgi:hypothetical protein